MTKKIIPVFAIVVAISCQCFSQETKDSTKRKNEIGLNLIPAIDYLSGSTSQDQWYDSYEPKYGIYYKRNLKHNGKANFGINYQPKSFPLEIMFFGLCYANDTIINYSHKWKPSSFKEIYLGYEFTNSKKRITFFYGGNIFYNNYSLYYETTKETFLIIRDSSGHFSHDSLLFQQPYDTVYQKDNNIGIQLSSGLSFYISNHFSLSVHTGINIPIYSYGVWDEKSNISSFHNPYSIFFSKVYFREFYYAPLKNFLKDISLAYHF